MYYLKNTLSPSQLNKKYPSDYILKFKKQKHKDSFVLQFLVVISNKNFIFTKVLDKNHLMNKNFETLYFFSDYLGFSKTYKISDELYICEKQRFSYSLKYLSNKHNEKTKIVFKKLGTYSTFNCYRHAFSNNRIF